jgi:hypothetical protein
MSTLCSEIFLKFFTATGKHMLMFYKPAINAKFVQVRYVEKGFEDSTPLILWHLRDMEIVCDHKQSALSQESMKELRELSQELGKYLLDESDTAISFVDLEQLHVIAQQLFLSVYY